MQNCAQIFRIFCSTFSTNVAQLLDFLSATFWGDWLYRLYVGSHWKIQDRRQIKNGAVEQFVNACDTLVC